MNTPETSQSIAKWAEEAFGPVADLTALVARAEQELHELTQAIQTGESKDNIAAEAADIAILLHRIAWLSGRDLNDSVDAKMAVNRERIWQKSGDGTGRHVKTE